MKFGGIFSVFSDDCDFVLVLVDVEVDYVVFVVLLTCYPAPEMIVPTFWVTIDLVAVSVEAVLVDYTY